MLSGTPVAGSWRSAWAHGPQPGLYPADARVTGIDVSERMLERARERAARLDASPVLLAADAERLPFGNDAFDTVTATCVFCSVEDPVRGLEEVRRVVKTDDRVRLLEHVRPGNPFVATLFDWLTPLTRRVMGPEINRRTEENVEAAGLEVMDIRREGIWREIMARHPSEPLPEA